MPLVSNVSARTDLTQADIQAMFGVFRDHFEGATTSIFQNDLCNKNWIILLRDSDSGELEGFSTLALYEPALMANL